MILKRPSIIAELQQMTEAHSPEGDGLTFKRDPSIKTVNFPVLKHETMRMYLCAVRVN